MCPEKSRRTWVGAGVVCSLVAKRSNAGKDQAASVKFQTSEVSSEGFPVVKTPQKTSEVSLRKDVSISQGESMALDILQVEYYNITVEVKLPMPQNCFLQLPVLVLTSMLLKQFLWSRTGHNSLSLRKTAQR